MADPQKEKEWERLVRLAGEQDDPRAPIEKIPGFQKLVEKIPDFPLKVDWDKRRQEWLKGQDTPYQAGPMDVRPTPARPVTHQGDPRATDVGLGAVSGTLTPLAMSYGLAGLAGVQPTPYNVGAATLTGLAPQVPTTPGVRDAPEFPGYHGTGFGFHEYSTEMAKDVPGIHIGTELGQAEQMTRQFDPSTGERAPGYMGWNEERGGGGNIRPVWGHLKKPLRVPDYFSMPQFGMRNTAQAFMRDVPLTWNTSDQIKIFDLADKMDAMARATTYLFHAKDPWIAWDSPQFTALNREFWRVIKKVAIENGHDGMIYPNMAEGSRRGLSIIAFEPEQVRSRYPGTENMPVRNLPGEETWDPNAPYPSRYDIGRVNYTTNIGPMEQFEARLMAPVLAQEMIRSRRNPDFSQLGDLGLGYLLDPNWRQWIEKMHEQQQKWLSGTPLPPNP